MCVVVVLSMCCVALFVKTITNSPPSLSFFLRGVLFSTHNCCTNDGPHKTQHTCDRQTTSGKMWLFQLYPYETEISVGRDEKKYLMRVRWHFSATPPPRRYLTPSPDPKNWFSLPHRKTVRGGVVGWTLQYFSVKILGTVPHHLSFRT